LDDDVGSGPVAPCCVFGSYAAFGGGPDLDDVAEAIGSGATRCVLLLEPAGR
jgi:hypothetical protein